MTPGTVGTPAAVDVRVVGDNLVRPDGKAPIVQVTRIGSSSSLEAHVSDASATALTVRVTTTSGTPPGPHIVIVRTPDGAAAGLFLVVDVPPPEVTGIDLKEGTPLGTFQTTIRGKGLSGATSVVFSGKGVVATILPASDDKSLLVRIAVASDAEPGPRTFEVTAPGGIARSGALTFTVR